MGDTYMKKYIKVALSGPLRKSFTYHTDLEIFQTLSPGIMVSAPLGKRRAPGFFLEETTRPRFPTKAIFTVLDQPYPTDKRRAKFYRWLADYYFANPADVFSLATPPSRAGAGGKIELRLSQETDESRLTGVPDRIRVRLLDDKPLRSQDITEINNTLAGGVAGLLQSGALSERSPQIRQSAGRLIGYKAVKPDEMRQELAASQTPTLNAFEIQAPGANETPLPTITLSEGIISRARLLDEGLTSYRLNKLVKSGVLEPQYADPLDELWKSLPQKRNLHNLRLNDEQVAAYKKIEPTLAKKFEPFLLHGVTGSGKTLLYCHLIEETLRQGKSALLLTPEITLAGETVAYLRGYLQEEVALWHSALSPGLRESIWRKLAEGEIKVLVGPRSALFAPLNNLGVIVVDEEHDESYKQSDPAPRFHGRDAAIMLAKILNIPIVLGSATPSLESYHNARRNRYTLLELTCRPAGARQPKIKLIDMNTDRLAGARSHFSATLKREIDKRLQANEQVILYLNRRGFSPRTLCRKCGHTPSCPDCQSTLTFHKGAKRLTCHFCGYSNQATNRCSECQSTDLLHLGAGTQKLEESVNELFPNARCVRLDSDIASKKSAAWRILQDFAERKYDILLGTQMISKGLDLPEVTLVGALATDAEMGLVDFRSSERTFARLTQVAGRSGRAQKAGVAFAQTYDPSSELMRQIKEGDYQSFFEKEMSFRKALQYPPFTNCLRIILQAASEKTTQESAARFQALLKEMIARSNLSCNILGPAPAQLYRLRGRYRRHLLLFSKRMRKVVDALTVWEEKSPRFGLPATVKITVDVNPFDLL